MHICSIIAFIFRILLKLLGPVLLSHGDWGKLQVFCVSQFSSWENLDNSHLWGWLSPWRLVSWPGGFPEMLPHEAPEGSVLQSFFGGEGETRR